MMSAPQIAFAFMGKPTLYKHRDNRLFPTWAYSLSQTLTQVPQSTVETLVFCLILYWVRPLPVFDSSSKHCLQLLQPRPTASLPDWGPTCCIPSYALQISGLTRTASCFFVFLLLTWTASNCLGVCAVPAGLLNLTQRRALQPFDQADTPSLAPSSPTSPVMQLDFLGSSGTGGRRWFWLSPSPCSLSSS